jgi:cytochrome c
MLAPLFGGVQAAEAPATEPIAVHQCRTCHAIGPGAKHGIGPHLNGVFDRRIASVPGYDFSPPMMAMGKAKGLWTVESIDTLLQDSAGFIPGTPMAVRLAGETDRRAIITMLMGIKADGSGAPKTVSDPAVSPEVLAIKGDPAYGEYLSSECVTCHQADGSNQGIPSITGWPIATFVTAMHAYKNMARENPVMQNVADALNDAAIAALATWFSTLNNANSAQAAKKQ